jgi:predicted amidophosphoribosyltransferase
MYNRGVTNGAVTLIIIFTFVLLSMLIKTAQMHRKHASLSDRRPCKHCQAVWMTSANFCGRCGKKL